MSEEHDDLVERLEDVSPIPDAMNQVPVKWIRKTDGFDDNQTVRDWLESEKGPKDYIPVIPLSALREVVEGLKEINAKSVIPCAIAPELAVTACYEINALAQRLLALLGEVRKS